MKNIAAIGSALACAAALVLGSTPAQATLANQTYSWVMTDLVAEQGHDAGYVVGSGTWRTGGLGPDDDGDHISDIYTITSFSGALYGLSLALLGSTTGYDGISSDGAFIYDNEIANLPGFTQVFDTDSGVLCSLSDGTVGNIWANGDLVTYNYYVYTPGEGYTVSDTNVTFVVSDVPEPGSLALLGVGFAGLALRYRRRFGAAAG